MGGQLLKLLMAVTGAEAAQRARRAFATMAGAAVCYLIAAACAVIALACLIATLWINMVPLVGAGVAPLVTAGVLAALAIMAVLAARTILRRGRAPRGAAPASPAIDFKEVFEKHKAELLLAALVGGLLASRGRAKQ